MALEIFRLMGSVFVDTDAATRSLHNVDNRAQGFGKTLLKGVGTAAKWAAGVAVAAGAAGTAIAVSAVKSYAEYEQLVGGIETLFGKSADTVMQYAKNAYKTAGMTANQYMETTTSFAAALLAGLKGDTAAAAKYADMAVTDMADNANKMGTAMESIQNAYQGFAKQNYTMLDNLKLGYGGTKKEMQRLLKDADAINKKQGKITKYSINNLNDVYEAIHVIQTEMGITGTTAKEATETISGQIGMIKARFTNFKNTLGETLAPAVKGILSKVIDNLPVIEQMVGGLATGVVKAVEFVMPFISAALDVVEKWFAKVPDIVAACQDKFSEVGKYLSEKFQPIVEVLRDWFDRLKDSAAALPGKLQTLKEKAVAVGSYISDKLQPTIDNLKKMFEAVKDKLQPLIDKLTEYVESGEAAEDATNLLKDAGDLLKAAFDGLAEAAAWVTEKIIEISDWCVEHYKTIETVAIVVASLAAAWGLVTAALAIWNGVAAIGAATTGLLSGAVTVLATAWAFLTSPITLVTLAIAAVIAIGVLLWRNWDTVKAKAIELWQALTEKFQAIKDAVVGKVTEIKDKIVAKFTEIKEKAVEKINELKDGMGRIMQAAKDTVSEKLNNIKAAYEKHGGGIKGVAFAAIEGVKGYYTAGYTFINKLTGGKLDEIVSKFKEKMNKAKELVKGVIDKIKSLFDFDFKLSIKLPKVKVDGGEAPWGIGGKGRLPSFSVKWFKKAYDQAMLLRDPSLFGLSPSGQLLGGGDGNGNEIVTGEAHLMRMIDRVVGANLAAQSGPDAQTVALLQDIRGLMAELLRAGIYLDTGALVGGLARPMDKKLGQLQAAKARG